MAANLKGGTIAARLGKRVVDRIFIGPGRLGKQAVDPIFVGRGPVIASRRGSHSSSYDKEVDDHVVPAVVPDIPVSGSNQYWAPNPHTGVFGPSTEKGVSSGSGPIPDGSSVLDQKVWFRPLEDVEKPHSPTQ